MTGKKEQQSAQFVRMDTIRSRWVRSTVSLPFRNHEKIGLDLEKIQWLMQLGGIKHLKVMNNPEGEISQHTPMVAGMNAKGEAVASRTEVEAASVSDYSLSKSSVYHEKVSDWIDLTVQLNINEIQQRALFSGENVKEAATWSKEINDILTQSLVSAGIEHLLKKRTIADWFFTFFYTSVSFAGSTQGNIFLPSSSEAPLIYVLPAHYLLHKAFNDFFCGTWFLDGFEKQGQGVRWSIFINWELDRAALLYLLGNLSTLAKALPPEEPTEKMVK